MILLDCGPSRRGFSRIGRFLQCPTKYAMERFVLPRAKQRHTGTKATNKGTLIGLGIGHWYAKIGAWQGGVAVDREVVRNVLQTLPVPEAVRDATIPGAVIVTDAAAFYDPFEAMEAACVTRPELRQWLDLSANCLSKYIEHYQRDMETIRVLAIEVEHEVGEGTLGRLDCPGHGDHGKPLTFTARADMVFADRSGRITIPDTKTSGTVTSALVKYYSRHGQFFGLEMIGRAVYGDRFDGARLNAVQTDGQKFERPALKPRPWAIGAFAGRLREAEHRIAALEIRTKEYWDALLNGVQGFAGLTEEQKHLATRADLTAHTWPAADHELTCFTRYGMCEFAELCDWGPAGLAGGPR